MDNLFVVYVGELADRQETLLGIEGEMARIVVREIECFIAVADNEKLNKAQDRLRIAAAGVVLYSTICSMARRGLMPSVFNSI